MLFITIYGTIPIQNLNILPLIRFILAYKKHVLLYQMNMFKIMFFSSTFIYIIY